MNDHEIDRLLLRAQPSSATWVPVAVKDLEVGRQDLLEAILAEAPITETGRPAVELVPRPTPWRGSPRRRLLMGVAATVAAAAVVVTPALLLRGHARPVATPAATSSASMSDIGNPYAVLDAPGWEVSYVDEYASNGRDSGGGEIRWADGDAELWLSWRPVPSDYRSTLKRQTKRWGAPADVTLLGEEALLFDQSSGEKTAYEAFLRHDGFLITVQGKQVSSLDDFRQRLGQISAVSPEQWWAALPESVVTPAESEQAAAGFLADVPLPEGVDASNFATDKTMNYESFGARVGRRAICLWLDKYGQGYAAGDEATMAAAVEALSDTSDWEVYSSGTASDQTPIFASFRDRMIEREPLGGEYIEWMGCLGVL